MAQFVPHPQKDLGAISAHAFSVKHSGVFVTHPRTHTAWRSIIQNASHVTLGDVRLENPRLAQNGNDIGEPTDAPPSTGFMLEGNIKLFGIEKYDVALQSWHGPPPPGIDVGSDIPVYQRVQLQDACLCDLVPLLEGTPFADIEFTNITITYQNYQFVQNMLPGWTITTELGVGEKSAELYRILHDVLGYSDANVQLQASVYLGLGHSWTGRPQVPSFVVTGVLDVASQINEVRQDTTQPGGVQLCAGVTLSRVGVSIYGVSIPTFGLNSTEHTQYGFKVFGDMHVGVPGSVTPLDLDFEMTEFSGAVDLFATVKGGLWKNAFGTGIDLDMVQLSASFPISSIKELACSVRAHFQAESASALITGSFTIGGGYSLSAYVEDLGCEGIVDLFRHYTGEELSLPSHVDVTIGSASIAIEKGAGLYIEVDRLAFDSYEANSAVVQLSSKGVRVRATAENLKLPGDIGISLVDGYMEVSFETQGSGRSTDVALGGKVQLNGFSSIPSIQAGVHLYKSSSTPALEWTVYGSFTDLGNTTTLGNLFPGLKKSFLQDFALQDLMFVAASSDDPALSHFNPLKYPIKKGVQFSALLAEVDPFNKLLRRTSFPGLILSACWNAGDSFVLDVVLPTDTLIHLGRGIVTDPITLSIDTERLLLRVATGVQIPVPESDTPLDFKASLTIQGESVKLEGEMHGLWKDPFGVSKGVSIGPFLELGLAIDLVEFPETGIPTSFSFAGGLAIGETEGQVAVQISEIPSRELLYGEMKKFGIKDLVAFARDLTQLPIPTVPNFVAFEDVKVYVSTGVTLSDITYPAGFSFDASLYVFGARFHASAEISGGVLAVSGNVDELVVGPLRVTGQRGVKPSVDLHVGMTAQELRVDGAMELLGAHVGLALHLEILPDPTFSFSFQLNFTDLLVFLVDAQMLGKIEDLNDVSGVNFVLHALFEQHVVEYVEKHVLETLEALKKSTDEKIQDAEAKVQTEEKKLQDGIDVAQANLTKAYDSWVQHAEQVHKTSQTFIDNYMNQLRTLENNVEEKRKSFNTDLKSAEGALEHANAARAAKMQSAEAAVTNAKSKWDSDVADAEKKLDETNRYMQEKFGSAEEDIAEAKRKVDSLQSEIDETNSRIHYCEDSPWYRFDLKAELVWQGTKLLALEGSKATADGVLWLAEKVVEGTAYLEAKAAIPAAKKVVEDVGEAGDLAFKGAQATLREVNTLTAAAIRDATHVLETVRKDGDALIRSAEFALQKFVNGNKALLTAAQHAVDGLIHSAEWIAYQAATSGLDLAKHATHALDIAKGALEAARKVADGAIVVTEEVVEAAMSTLNITRIELGTTLDVLLGSGGYHFEADVSGTIIEGPFALHLKLDMKNTAQLILDISHE
ncbi:hypothetical protein C8Q79DRAFT_915601 [Trametes meyenii]|nr:hypothetical protein C8Q79DRAFT_915601 [Trametes meyenii]